MIYSRMMLWLRRFVLFWFASAALLVTVASCGDDDQPSTTTAPASISASPTTAPTSPAATASPTAVPFGGGRDPVAATPGPGFEAALLKDIRIAKQNGFDRITFEFGEGIPGYDVRYVEPPIVYDPRGDEMQIQGSAFIVVRMERAAAYDPNTGSPTYLGPLELKPGLPSILEAERVGDFEAVLTWALGLSAEADFRVTPLDTPARLVIDVAHP